MKYKFQIGGNNYNDYLNDTSYPEDDEELYNLGDEEEQDDNQDEEGQEQQDYSDVEEEPNYVDYLGELANNNDAMDMIGLVFNHNQQKEQGIDWLSKKDKSVDISGLSPKLIDYLNSLPDNVRNKLIATSGRDSMDVHQKGSRHGTGEAIDLRYSPDLYNYISQDPNLQKAGLKLLNPNHGTAPHLHIQTK